MSQADRITAEINAKYPNDSERRFYELSFALYNYAQELEKRCNEAVERDAARYRRYRTAAYPAATTSDEANRCFDEQYPQ